MSEYPTRSPLQLRQQADGAWTVGLEGVTRVDTIDEQEPPRDWLAELDLPKDWSKLEAMARPRGLSARRVRCIIGDESPTCFPGAWRYRPQAWTYADDLNVTLGHLSFIVGRVEHVYPGSRDQWAAEKQKVDGATGEFVIGEVRLYDSDLADAAWEGIRQGIFGHVCAILVRSTTAPLGTGELLEVALTDRPACPGARILETWEEETAIG